MMLGHAARRFAVTSLLLTLPLLAACSDDNNNNPPPATATATRSAAATATATQQQRTATATSQVPTSTATGAIATATRTSAATSTATTVATSTFTQAPTGTATPVATFTLTPLFTATATATGTSAATVTATATPTGTSAATFTPTATPTGTVAGTITPTFTAGPEGFRDVANAQPASFNAHGSVNQVYITDAAPGTVLELVGDDSFVKQAGTTDSEGSLILREVPVGTGYHIVSGFPGPLAASGALTVTAWDDPPDQSFYDDQVLPKGYGYLTTRDGTSLAINVYLPGPIDAGPYPTLVEYSGYDPANPDSSQPSTLISTVLGFAVVGVNIRGTGCSGGAFQFFEPLQSTDGYDVIETVAAQPWVKNHKVGMVGLSYPGISQLFVAQLQPPSLASIAPLSVISDTGRGTLYPGGILNNGFATDWAADRKHDAMPGGQGWSQKRINDGDQVCIDNQKLKLQAPDILQMIADNEFYNAAVADAVTPALFVHNINVPVFLAGAAQDEQVGGYWSTMLDKFTGTDKVRFTLVNGGHTEPLIPAIFHRWMEFLWIYVRNETPQTPAVAQTIVDVVSGMIFTSSGLTLPPDRFTGMTYEEAKAAFEAEPPVRVLFESGAGDAAHPGSPVPGFEYSFPAWPVPSIVPTAYYFGDDGALLPDQPTGDDFDTFVYDPSRAQQTNYIGGSDGIWAALPNWNWQPLPDGKALAYASQPLTEDLVMVGSGSVDLWIRSSATDVDLQVTLSEIRPDGQEVYIQNGWLRASRRALEESMSTDLRPVPSGLEADVEPVPSDEFVLARVELFPFAHAFRPGSRVRISIEAPGGDRPLWKFEALPANGEVTVDVARAAAFPSRVLFPVVPDLEIPTGLPACPSLRGQPCRTCRAELGTPTLI
jgi:predicted acyl esterase